MLYLFSQVGLFLFMNKPLKFLLCLITLVLTAHYLSKDYITMKSIYDKVKEFNETFGVELSEKVIGRAPSGPLNYNMMEEENAEYLDAVLNDNKVEVFDALLDQLYVLMGNFQKHGFTMEHIEDGIEEVHSSNMSKLEDGEVIRREDGKVMKGKDYFKPDLKGYLDSLAERELEPKDVD